MCVIKIGGRWFGKNIFMYEVVNGIDYVNVREIFCEMVFDFDFKGYMIVLIIYVLGEEC